MTCNNPRFLNGMAISGDSIYCWKFVSTRVVCTLADQSDGYPTFFHGFWNNSASNESNGIGGKRLRPFLKKPSGCENTDEHIQRGVRIRLKRIVPEGLFSE